LQATRHTEIGLFVKRGDESRPKYLSERRSPMQILHMAIAELFRESWRSRQHGRSMKPILNPFI
jgi:hypothetical protein